MRITKDPEVRRQEIIDSAKALFEKKGIRKTSMSEIAETSVWQKGSFITIFPLKKSSFGK